MTKALVPLADGVEEMEAVIIIDTLRRAGWEVTSAAVATGPTVLASRGVRLVADAEWTDITPSDFDVLTIPGGAGGTDNLSASDSVLHAVKSFSAAGKLVTAICAGPLVLQAAGILEGRRATCHPGVRSNLTVPLHVNERVVIDGQLVTSQGPGTAFEFALALIRLVDGKDKADAVAKGMIL